MALRQTPRTDLQIVADIEVAGGPKPVTTRDRFEALAKEAVSHGLLRSRIGKDGKSRSEYTIDGNEARRLLAVRGARALEREKEVSSSTTRPHIRTTDEHRVVFCVVAGHQFRAKLVGEALGLGFIVDHWEGGQMIRYVVPTIAEVPASEL